MKIDGPRLVFTVHVSGTYAINAMFAPSIAVISSPRRSPATG